MRNWLLTVLCWASALCLPAHAQTVTYVHTDALGSPVVETDANRNVIERNEYEPYGRSSQPLDDGPGYTGHVGDAATGLIYAQQRYYDPTVGYFLSVDPVTAFDSTADHFHLYRYVKSNPYRFVDPDGRDDAEAARALMIALEVPKKTNLMLLSFFMGADVTYTAPSGSGELQPSAYPGEAFVPARAAPLIARTTVRQASQAAQAGPRVVLGAIGQIAAKPQMARVGELISTHGRTMSNKQFSRLVSSIRQEGVKVPITITKHEGRAYILDGHHRAAAALRAGVREVPVREVKLPWGAYKDPNDLNFSPGPYSGGY